MDEKLNKIWAKGEYIGEIFMRTLVFCEVEMDGVPVHDDLVLIHGSVEFVKKERARTRSKRLLLDRLVSGHLRAIGRIRNEQTVELQIIPANFWLDCFYDGDDHDASDSTHHFEMIRCVSDEEFRSFEGYRPRRKPGPQSQREYRLEAINYCRGSIENFERLAPDTRLMHYRRYLEKNHKQLDLRRGFSLSTFQDDEAQLR